MKSRKGWYLARGAELAPLGVVDVETLAPPAQQVQHQQGAVRGQRQRGRVPDQHVAQQVDLSLWLFFFSTVKQKMVPSARRYCCRCCCCWGTDVGIGGDPISDAARQQQPIPRTGRVHVVLHVLVGDEQHADLQFHELLEERVLRRLQRDEFRVVQFQLAVLLLLAWKRKYGRSPPSSAKQSP